MRRPPHPIDDHIAFLDVVEGDKLIFSMLFVNYDSDSKEEEQAHMAWGI
jgi:hypothetical protein